MMKILIASSIPMIRDGLRALVEAEADFVLVGEVEDGGEVGAMCARLMPEVVVLHDALAGLAVGTLLAMLRGDQPDMRVVLLTDWEQEAVQEVEGDAPEVGGLDVAIKMDVYALAQLGVYGCVSLADSNFLLAQAIRTVGMGGTCFSRTLLLPIGVEKTPEERFLMRAREKGLSKKELAVARLVGEGMRNREIGAALGVKERTVEFHVSHVLSKLGVETRVEMALWVRGV